jgi:hypothetical protein
VFQRQFERVAEYNCWLRLEKSTYLIIVLQGCANNVLHGVPKGATYEEIPKALEDRFWDRHLDAAYRSQLKLRAQGVRESLQEFETGLERLATAPIPHYPRIKYGGRHAKRSQAG